MSVGPMTILGAIWGERPTVIKRKTATASYDSPSIISADQANRSLGNICQGLRIPHVGATGYLNEEYAQDAQNLFDYIHQTKQLVTQARKAAKTKAASHVLGELIGEMLED